MAFGTNILEIAIGMLLIYTILSLICSSATELIANRLLALRAKNLEAGIRSLLTAAASGDEQKIADQLYQHPLIMALVRKPVGKQEPTAAVTAQAQVEEKREFWLVRWIRKALYNVDNQKPSYIPARTFSMALLNILEKESSQSQGSNPGLAAQTFDGLRDMIVSLPDERFRSLKQQLLPVIDSAGADVIAKEARLRQARQNIDHWFDSAMEQTTAWYKQRVQIVTLGIAFVICAAVNADSLMLVNALANDPTLRSAIVAEAEQFVQQPPQVLQNQLDAAQAADAEATAEPGGAAEATPEPDADSGTGSTPDQQTDTSLTEVQELQQKLEALGVFGWSSEANDRRSLPGDIGGWFHKLVGLLISTFAVSLGAPFWFGILNKLVNLRSANQPPPVNVGATVTATAKASIPGEAQE